jgi:glutaminyl-peptide cyclotransferase
MKHFALRPGFTLFLILNLILITGLAACSSAPAAPTPTATPLPAPSATPAPTATTIPPTAALPARFDGQRAYQDLEAQMAFGPRTPGSQAHAQVIEWMKAGLAQSGWTVEVQDTTQDGQPVHNVIAKRGSGAPWTIIGAHYDSRMKADNDPDPARQNQPVPGANDGASGVAVLMELARDLPKDLNGQVWLAFFDSEDQGKLPGWDWILGSRAMANSLTGRPDAVVIIDMIGDANLNILKEQNSYPVLVDQIWNTAASLGYEQEFIPRKGYNMLDDHTPFLEKGFHAVDIIDFDYPEWHTTADTADKVSAKSLQIVGDTLLAWLKQVHK